MDAGDAGMHGRALLHASLPVLRRATDAALSILFAPSCAACGELLERPSGGAVCHSCWQSILPLTPPLCDRCGVPLPAWRAVSLPMARCPRCRRMPQHVDQSRAIGAFDGALRAIVHALKYQGRRSLAKPLAGMMRSQGAAVLDGADFLVPVPLHSSRRRQRGFNQATDLARHIGLPVRLALRRSRRTTPQTGLPAARRRRNVQGAFVLTQSPLHWLRLRRPSREELAGSIVVLIDDVSTTGATLEACARVLKESGGVSEVRALTAARAVTGPR